MENISANCKNILKVLIFVTIFIITFGLLQNIFTPKWYYPNKPLLEPMGRILPGFYAEDKNTIDVLFLGASASHFGISPMEIYEAYSLKSYNLSSNGQPFEISYFLLKECLESQKPKVVVLEIGGLFFGKQDDSVWHYIIDAMPMSKNKYCMAQEYASKSNNQKAKLEALVPLYGYHERWKELSERDFTDFFRNKNFYSKGYYMLSMQNAGISEEEMNSIEEMLYKLPTSGRLKEYHGNDFFQKEIDNVEYFNLNFSVDSLRWLLKISELCKENNIDLVTTKVPVSYSPIIYDGAWTAGKHSVAVEVCRLYGIEFIDMEYDVDIGIDWLTDTRDGGTHLNILGAKKVSRFLGQYLISQYDLSRDESETWNLDLQVYQQIRDVALLQMETDFETYLSKLLNEAGDKTIFISASDEMSLGLNLRECIMMKKLGLKSDFADAYRKSYLAIVENGNVKYEGISDNRIEYEGNFRDSELKYKVISSGYCTNPVAHIFIEDVDYAIGGRGLSFVVYDNEKQMVLDSVCFDTCDIVHTVSRNQNDNSEYLRKYESFMIEYEARR